MEGPWSFGEKPLRQNVAGESTEARRKRNEVLLSNDLDVLVKEGVIALQSVPCLKRAKDIIEAIQRQKEVKPITGKSHDHNVWIYGPAGIGKTGWLTDYFNSQGGFYNKDKSKYWNNYENQKFVLVNDLEKDETHMLGKLK